MAAHMRAHDVREVSPPFPRCAFAVQHAGLTLASLRQDCHAADRMRAGRLDVGLGTSGDKRGVSSGGSRRRRARRTHDQYLLHLSVRSALCGSDAMQGKRGSCV
eukprot:1913186-Rhodomonas_salina.4